MQILNIDSIEALDEAIPAVLEALNGRRKIALYGEMGAGKTSFSKAFCRHLGVTDHTASPTFSLVNEYHYQDPNGERALVHHLDLYRLRTPEEVYDLGIEDLLYDPWYCLIEWPQLIESLLPDDVAVIRLEISGPNQRTISIH